MVGTAMGLAGLALEGGALAVASLGPLFWVLDRCLNPGFLVGPAIYIYAFHLLGYAIGPLGQRYINGSETFLQDGMVMAQWGSVLGILTFVPVYYAAFRFVERRAAPKRAELSPDDSRWKGFTITLGIAAIIIVAYAYLTGATRRLGEFETPDIQVQTAASAFSAVQQVVFVFLAFIAARRRTVLAFGGWATAILAYSAYTFLEGTRGLAFVVLILSCIGFVLGGIRRKVVIVGLLATLAVLIPASSIVALYRSSSKYTSMYDQGLAERTAAFSHAAADLEMQPSQGETSSLGIFLQSVTANTVDRIMEQTPDRVPFAYFRNLDHVLYVWMPRVIAPDRPSVYESNDIANEYGVGHDGVKSWTYTPTVGEGYRRFGWAGISWVYAFVACIYGATTGLCWARRRQREWAALLVVCFVEAPGAWSSTVLTCITRLLWNLPKYMVFFIALRCAQDFIANLSSRRFSQQRIQSGSVTKDGTPNLCTLRRM